MWKRPFILLIIGVYLLGTSVFLPGCSVYPVNSEKTGEIKYLIGMSQANLGEPWRVVMNEEIKKEAARHEGAKVIFTDAGQSSQKQISDVEKLLGLGIDLLIISPNEAEPLTPIIRKAYKKVPVIILDRDIISDDYTMFIGANNKLIGQKAGIYAAQLLGQKGGNIVEISGLPGSLPAQERSEGFKNEIKGHPNIVIVKTLVADWLRDNAENTFRTYLRNHSDIDLVYAHNDPMALGAYRAAMAAEKKDIQFVGIDGLPGKNGGLELVEKSILQGTFTYPTGGREAVQYALKILQNKDVPKRLTLESKKITK
ncbi:substrate-binding domain-containing protein [Bacillaceae bacterium C204]|uniref:substrate-binding domain-containing protein n=1 Tax=Neobacillus sp. 204 TaxID=3383351 RepID=UPI00397A9567